ncbi:MAG: Gfo/Idh/MocA family oxidoreductase [Deltaproteobacteria bacterium]|nr:Gfo/Idh/MocA family oxidoreductase [Deltaproteobacteria bacterium]
MAIGVGIIGTGKHGGRYLRHVADVPRLRVAALCRRDRVAGERQAAAVGARFHADPEALVADPAVDLVVLVVPPTLNVRLATAAARSGKALLIEKPLAPTVAECRVIAEEATRAGVTAMVAHTLRFNGVVRALREALPSIGRLHAAVLTQRFEPSELGWLDRRAESGGGIVLHTGVHGFDALRFLTGREAMRVSAAAGRVATRDTEDNFAATIALDDGILAQVAGSRATVGRGGAIELAGRAGQLVGDHVHGIAARLVGTTRMELAIGAPAMTVEAVLAEMAAALVQRRTPAITLADGAKSVAIAEACYRSIASGRAEAVERW